MVAKGIISQLPSFAAMLAVAVLLLPGWLDELDLQDMQSNDC